MPQRTSSLAYAIVVASLWIAGPAFAGAGSGQAWIFGPNPVYAGKPDSWTVLYHATEPFSALGGVIEIDIPPGWTPPQHANANAAGYVDSPNVDVVNSITTLGQTITVLLGAPPLRSFGNPDSVTWVSILYGVGGGNALATPQTTVQDTVRFIVRSDPQLTGSPQPIASSPWVAVVADTDIVSVAIVDQAGAVVDTLTRTTDQDPTPLFFRGYDAYGNLSRQVIGDWTLSGGVGAPVPASGGSTALRLDRPGTGKAYADSGGTWIDSTGVITVLHGAYAGLTMTSGSSSVTAGAPVGVTARALDADGNTVTDGAGSAATIRFVAFVDSAMSAAADPELTDADEALSSGTYAGTLTARRVGTYWIAARDTATGFTSERHRLDVAPAGPDRIALSPDTLRLAAGIPDTVAVRVFDAFGNRAAVLTSETLTLWTDRQSGTFRSVGGSAPIFEVTVPAGSDSARFTFTDTRTTASEGRIRAIDANGQSPFLGTAGAPVFTGPGTPASITLAAAPDTIVANNTDTAAVTGMAQDAYGNAVAAGERFTLTGTLVVAATDQDPGAPGAQLLADSTGALSGSVRAGVVAGAGSAALTAERAGPGGPASASAAVRLLAGTPDGFIPLLAPADSLAADSVATLAISASGLHDAHMNPVQDGEKYTVATTLATIQTADQDAGTPGVQVLSTRGAIAFTIRAGDVLGLANVTATSVRDSNSNGALGVRLVPGAVSATRSSVAAGSPAPVGPTGSTISITLRDGQDHPLPGVPSDSIAVTITGLSASLTPLGSATDAAGRLDVRATTSTAGTGTAHVTARGMALAAQPAIVYQAGALDHYTVSGPPGPLTSGTGATLTVNAFDSFGNPLPGESGETLTPTVTSGAASVPPSVTLTNGTAAIPFTPTQAAPLTIQVSDGARPAVTYGPVAVNPSGAATVTLTPSSLSLTPAQFGIVTVTVQDSAGNRIAGDAVTFYLGGPATAGSLESIGGTTGGPGSQSGFTNGSGRLAVRYRAPSAAPAADSIFVSGGAPSPAGIRATISPGPAASLRVTPSTVAWTAGVPESVSVQALDSFGNLATADAAVVTLRPSGALVWSPASGSLVNGQFFTSGRDTVAETVSIAADRAGGGTGSGGSATVAPALAAGTIPSTATRDSLTADGRSASTVTLGPVRDAFGNMVGAGTLIGVSALQGTLVASDQSAAYPGLDLATGADSKASVLLLAPVTPGPDTLSATTRLGSALGTHAFTYVPPPSLTYVAGSLSPGMVLPGSSQSFSLQAGNTGTGSIQLSAGSSFSFGAGATTFSATLGAGATIGPGATATLSLAAATIPAALTPGSYAPSFRALGLDGTGAAFDFYPSLAGAQVSVLGALIAAVSAAPDPVPLGYLALSLVFDVTNPSGSPGTLSGASVGYSTGAFITGSPAPALGTVIPAGGTTRFTFPVQVPESGIPSGTVVHATLLATVAFGSNSVAASNAPTLDFQVVSAAQIAAVAGSSAPARFLRGRTSRPTVRVSNSGAAAVTLNRGTTRLVIDLGGSTLSTALSANTAVAPSDPATLAFDSLAVPVGAAKGRHPAQLVLDGVESGQPFAATIPFAPDSVDVLDPALLSVLAGSLLPDTVSSGQTRPVAITLRNTGDIPLVLDASTALRFGPPLSLTRTLGTAPTLNAGQSLALSFTGGALGSGSPPGTTATTLDVFGMEDGVLRAQSLPGDPLEVMAPAALQFVGRSTSPSQTRPGQTIDVTLDVRNGGGSPFVLDPASSRLTVTDGVDVMTGLGSGSAFSLAPGAAATVTFPALSVPSSMASQPYRVDLTLQGTEWGLGGSAAVSSPDSELVVLEALAAIQARAIDTAPPIQVATGSAPARVWGIELQALAATGSATGDSLRSVAITVLTDGSAGPAPAGSIASIALRDRFGALLVRAVPTPVSANPILLTIAPALAMGGAPESLFIDAAFRAGTQAQRVAFQLGQATDVIAVDVFTGGRVPVVGGGGLPFAPLTSRDITFFEKPHGYPNPFHAGSEAVLLSYVLGQDAAVKVSIYTLLGDLVRELSLATGAPGGTGGLNEVPWDGRNGKGDLVRPGVYVARIDGPGVSERIKVGVLR